MSELLKQIEKRRTFAIISHPDAGKTTLTEQLLLVSGSIQMAGTIKGRKATRHATSDWMALEQQRGISVTTSVMQFPYRERIVNLLDTPGHADFTEDTYRTLTAVDSALMMIDAAKGVEERTVKLMEVCRLRTTPIMTFINKLDRDGLEPIELLDNIESVLNIQCAPITWPIGMGKLFRGVYHLLEDRIYLYDSLNKTNLEVVDGLDNPLLDEKLGQQEAQSLREQIELVQGASHAFNLQAYLAARLTPVFFGSALNNFGIAHLMDFFVKHAPAPQSRQAKQREVSPAESKFSGFVFKVQANMDPAHRDRIAFMRIVSGQYQKGMKMQHIRLQRAMAVNNALTFMAGARESAEQAYAGDIIGLHNHGNIQIGDAFSIGETLKFTGIPNFAPELFRVVRLKDPLKQKALLKGLIQLSEEGATQVFRPLQGNDLILGAVGALQFDVVAFRLQHEYRVACYYESASVVCARWVESDNKQKLEEFKQTERRQLARDSGDYLTYLAPSQVNLELTCERWPEITFQPVREH